MTLAFTNAVPVARDLIPVMDLGSFREWILQGCNTGKGRVVSLLHEKKNGGFLLTAILGFDSRGELKAAATLLKSGELSYPSLTPQLPEMQSFERELFENTNIKPEGHPWLKPLRKQKGYSFYRIQGDQVHEVAVGPVHAGIIEPGHFRFQCHGERILHLEIQLGYQHRGAEQMMVQASPGRQAVLAESIAGDTVIGHATAHAQALEGLAACAVPARAATIRAIALELERLSNHAGDLGALASDVGFLPAAAWFGRLRGEFLNLLLEISGNRFGRSLIRPGGVLFDLEGGMPQEFKKRLSKLSAEMQEVSDLLFGTANVRARFEYTGTLPPKTAIALGLVGPAARASDLIRDVRLDYPTGAYRFHFFLPVRVASGDVYARARVRELEARRSIGMISEMLESLQTEKMGLLCGEMKPSSLVVSLIEGWRGEIAHVVTTDKKGKIDNYKIVDPSFRNWMGLALAMRGGEISDFPLVNKSFNLSYCGHDL